MCALPTTPLHMQRRAHQAPGIPCALRLERAGTLSKPRAKRAARSRSCVRVQTRNIISRHRPRKRATQYSEALAMESKSCGVLDHPPSRVMTAFYGAPPHQVNELAALLQFVHRLAGAGSVCLVGESVCTLQVEAASEACAC